MQEVTPEAKPEKKPIKLNRVEKFIIKHTPLPVKRSVDRLISKLPPRMENWIRNNSFMTICIVYAIRGLFFRPLMWPIYASIAAWFSLR